MSDSEIKITQGLVTIEMPHKKAKALCTLLGNLTSRDIEEGLGGAYEKDFLDDFYHELDNKFGD